MAKKSIIKGKRARIMSFFWSALLIFIVSVESLIVLIFFSKAILTEKAETYDYDLSYNYGPVLPVYVLGSKELMFYIQNSNIDLYRDKALDLLSNYLGEDSSISIKRVDEKLDSTYYVDDKKYFETYYIEIPSKHIMEIRIELPLSFFEEQY